MFGFIVVGYGGQTLYALGKNRTPELCLLVALVQVKCKSVANFKCLLQGLCALET